MNNNISSKDKFITEHTYKAMGFTKPEIEKLQNAYHSENRTHQQNSDYQEILSNTLREASYRRDNKRISCGLISPIVAVSLFSIAKISNACSKQESLYLCVGLVILSTVFSAVCFQNIGETSQDLDQKFKKAEEKAKLKWEKITKKTKEQTR